MLNRGMAPSSRSRLLRLRLMDGSRASRHRRRRDLDWPRGLAHHLFLNRLTPSPDSSTRSCACACSTRRTESEHGHVHLTGSMVRAFRRGSWTEARVPHPERVRRALRGRSARPLPRLGELPEHPQQRGRERSGLAISADPSLRSASETIVCTATARGDGSRRAGPPSASGAATPACPAAVSPNPAKSASAIRLDLPRRPPCRSTSATSRAAACGGCTMARGAQAATRRPGICATTPAGRHRLNLFQPRHCRIGHELRAALRGLR